MSSRVEVLVCTTCRTVGAERVDVPGQPRAGTCLQQSLASRLPEGATLRGVECLSNCSAGCTVVFRGPRRWSYVYGDIDPERDVDAVVEGLERYVASTNGIVPWRERPEHLKRHCVARLPPETLDV